MRDYEVVIGLEVHVRLATASKLFCACSTLYGNEPNTQVCEVCAAMPGALPVLNEKAVEYAVRAGLALDCRINPYSVFARKNYFYPDSPKGYQISQFDLPVCGQGFLEISVDGNTKKVGITRIHLEDDAGKNIHSPKDNASYVDLNRAGVPLIEIVSDPDMRSAEEAVAYLKSLHAIVTSLGICDGNMEEGSFRCDANVSLRPRGQEAFGTRTELKNLNSFRHVHKAIEYEVSRQEDALEDGEIIVQETRLYDSVNNTTQSMRGKEEAHDYRYFPDPDLLPVLVSEAQLAAWQASQPELPLARRARLLEAWALSQDEADMLAYDRHMAAYFEAACGVYPQGKRVVNLMCGPLLRELNGLGIGFADCAFNPAYLAELARIVDSGLISAKIANDIFPELYQQGAAPERFVTERGLVQVSDTAAIEAALQTVLDENPEELAALQSGKTKLMSFFVGQVMKAMRGKANPAVVNELLQKKLG